MSESSAKKTEDTQKPLDKSTVVLMLSTAADTTWRMFVPIIGIALLGIWADHTFATKPWMTVVGIIIGVVIASVLVRRQLQQSGKNK
ncbi:MAG: hypothetical protein JWN75_203 [Candidatus Saccharibacteria bacterium]|nr:hypothetical protein [Candidatus Saccharibacteria bacterium]